MFTTCNECGTVFRIGPAELRVAEGQVRCGHCSATFNALATLTDEPPPTTILPQLQIPPHLERQVLPDPEPDPEPEPEPQPEPEPDISVLDSITGEETLEFNVPEDNWSDFFVEPADPQPPAAVMAIPAPEDEQFASDEPDPEEIDEAPVYRIDSAEAAADVDSGPGTDADAGTGSEPSFEADVPVIALAAEPQLGTPPDEQADTQIVDADLPAAAPEVALQPVLAGRPLEWRPEFEPAAPPPRGRRIFGIGAALLALALVIQLIHYQRDELAANPALHGPLTRVYAALNLSLLPDWNLNAYEVRGSEAVAGATARGALDVLARIAVVGSQPVGLPMVRISLHDRFAKSLGSRVFTPDEYLDAAARPSGLLAPGHLIPVKISLRDPGTEAFGYEVDVCVLYRQGLVCQQQRDPKAPFTR
jgi:predicted Zn finger-like uncharacterized protein